MTKKLLQVFSIRFLYFCVDLVSFCFDFKEGLGCLQHSISFNFYKHVQIYNFQNQYGIYIIVDKMKVGDT